MVKVQLSKGKTGFERAHPIEIVIGAESQFAQTIGLSLDEATALSVNLCKTLGEGLIRARKELEGCAR
jgi:hypothetical protein